MSPSVVVGRAPAITAPVTLMLPVAAVMARRLAEDAERRGLGRDVYARLLLEAAWTARHGPTGDAHLDRTVAAALDAGPSDAVTAAAERAEALRRAGALAEKLEAATRRAEKAEGEVHALVLRLADAASVREEARHDLDAARRRIADLERDHARDADAGAAREADLHARLTTVEAELGRAREDAARLGADVAAAIVERGTSVPAVAADNAQAGADAAFRDDAAAKLRRLLGEAAGLVDTVRHGLDAPKAPGRPPSYAATRGVVALAAAGQRPAEIAAALGIGAAEVRRVLAERGRG